MASSFTRHRIAIGSAAMGAADGVKYSAFDIAARADLWFCSNPVFIEVTGSTVVAGIR